MLVHLIALHHCTACHSLQGTRYSSLPALLGMRAGAFRQLIGTNGQHFHDTITTGVPPAQFARTARDIVAFLYAVAHPHARERARLGPWIIGLFVLLSILTYVIYRLYWRRVATSEDRWWRAGR